MKVALAKQKDIHILAVEGDIDAHQVKVLKAGITKLLKDGKNRIILEVSKVGEFEASAIKEISTLNLLARELAGDIVIAGPKPELKQKITQHSVPPTIGIYDTRELAFKYLENPNAAKKEAKPAAGAAAADAAGAKPADGKPGAPGTAPAAGAAGGSHEPSSSVKKLLEAKDAEILELKKKLKDKEAGELERLKKENSTLIEKSKTLEDTVNRLMLERLDPPEANSYKEKNKTLENQNKEMIEKIKEMEE